MFRLVKFGYLTCCKVIHHGLLVLLSDVFFICRVYMLLFLLEFTYEQLDVLWDSMNSFDSTRESLLGWLIDQLKFSHDRDTIGVSPKTVGLLVQNKVHIDETGYCFWELR